MAAVRMQTANEDSRLLFLYAGYKKNNHDDDEEEDGRCSAAAGGQE